VTKRFLTPIQLPSITPTLDTHAAPKGYVDTLTAEYGPKAADAPHFLLRHTSTWSLANSTSTALTWNTEVRDAFNMHASSNAQVTIPTAGIWLFTASVCADNVSAAGPRTVFFTKNSTTGDTANASDERFGNTTVGDTGSSYKQLATSYVGFFAVNDLVRVVGFQVTGASRTWGVSTRQDLNHFSGVLLHATSS
jgi:hypothetical protein